LRLWSEIMAKITKINMPEMKIKAEELPEGRGIL
jgi:hypothetical protein